MLVQSVRFTFAPEDVERAIATFRELRDASRTESGVVEFEACRSQHDPNAIVLWEAYRDDAALDAHHATEHFQRLVVDGVAALAKDRMGEKLSPI